MTRVFNINGACIPDRHYMVDIEQRLKAIKKMIDAGDYFTINRARQYGKTTVLRALAEYLEKDYIVLSIDFQRMSASDFDNETAFVQGLVREITRRFRRLQSIPDEVEKELSSFREQSCARIAELFDCFSEWCLQSDKPVVFIVDEVDTATNNQVFLDFLAQLRAAYLERDIMPAFQSVILAGVYDVRSIKRKINEEKEYRENSPWNIAAEFCIDMNFSADEIAGMLSEYEQDWDTGMDAKEMANLLYHYTSGYPYLVSWLCRHMDGQTRDEEEFRKKNSAWTKDGFFTAVKKLVEDRGE